MVIDKNQKSLLTDKAILSHRNIRKKEHEKQEKYHELKEELEKMWKIEIK